MPEKISIMKESGELLNSNIVSIFMIPDTQKKYVITTENAVDPHGLTVLHVSELVNNDEDLVKIATDEEWSSIKTIMRAIISGNVGSYQYLPLIEKARVKGQYSRDISVSASAAKQMVDNYATALKSLADTKKATPAVEAESSSDSIFPTENVVTTETNEVSPGIADVTKTETEVSTQAAEPVAVPLAAAPVVEQPAPAESEPATTEEVVTPVVQETKVVGESEATTIPVQENAPVQEEADVVVPTEVEAPSIIDEEETVPAVVEETQVVATDSNESGSAAPVVEQPTPEVVPAVAPVVEEPVSVEETAPAEVKETVVVPVEPVQSEPVKEEVKQEAVVAMDTPVFVVAEPAAVEETPVAQQETVPAIAEQEVKVVLDQNDIEAITDALFKKIDESKKLESVNQVVEVQNVNFNANPSFAPNATLDEVVAGSQQVFMDGVNNLVQTMTEKLYRELHQKEIELNEREELLNQREKMLNEQIAMMVNNYNKMQHGNDSVAEQGSEPVATAVVQNVE
ncbi:MAG: hypothetical protein IJ475_02255 [Bacilli bacterium]|nr:hypothetical protein [Bacilli bacterium]